MKNSLFLLVFLCVSAVYAQPNTNVYLFDIVKNGDNISFENIQAIANNTGYNNQPSFYDDNKLLFVSTRNNQTDIVQYKIAERDYSWLTNTPNGSEYSPLKVPNSQDISAIRLDTSGLQRLYRYDTTIDSATVLIKDMKVGYHVWDNDQQLVTSALVKNGMNLMLNYLPENKSNTISQGVGRSLHKIPESDLISFISSSNGARMVSSYDPVSGKIKNLLNMPSKAQDMCWLDKNTMLVPKGKSLMRAYADKSKSIEVLYEFKEKQIHNISRIAVSPNGKYLALVTEENPEMIADKQAKTFNSGDLNAFVNCFSNDVIVANFPNTTLYKGRSNMKTNYGKHFDRNLNTQVEIVNRIVIGDIIIDEEIVRENEEEFHQAAIYKVKAGYISSMSFVHEKEKIAGIEALMQKRVKNYNSRSLHKLQKNYAEDVEFYNYPNKLKSKGKQPFIEKHIHLFDKATDLNAEIKNQIVVGNTVISDEIVLFGKAHYRTIVIYEIVDNLIKRVTFIR